MFNKAPTARIADSASGVQVLDGEVGPIGADSEGSGN